MSTSVINTVSSTSIWSSLNIDKPEEMIKLFQVFGNDGADTYDFCKAMGWMSPVAQEDYQSTEKDRIHETFHDKNGSAAAATKLITLDAQDIDANNHYYPRQGDEVRFRNGKTGIISNDNGANPPVFTVQTQTGTNLPLTVAGEEITIISRVQGEGSELLVGALTKVNKRSYRLQIIPEKFIVTGTEMTNQKWVTELPGVNGSMFYLMGQQDAEMRSRLHAVGAWIYGEQNTVNVTDALSTVNAPYRTMSGLLNVITASGINLTYPAGLLSVNDYINVTRRLDKQGAGLDLLCWGGFDFISQSDQVLMDYFKNYNVSQVIKGFTTNYFGGNEGLAAAVGFSAFKINGFNFMFKKNAIFSHPKYGGATGFTDSARAVIVPMSKQSTSEGMVPSVGWRYKALDGHNRMSQIWINGAAGANPAQFIGFQDLNQLDIRQHIGSHFVGVNQMVNLTQA